MFSKHHFFKSIIILIILLSLTISIFILPASAIVTGTLPPSDIATIFSLSNYRYLRLRGYTRYSYEGGLWPTVRYPNSTQFATFTLYPYLPGNHVGITNENSYMQFYSRFIPYNNNSSLEFYYDETPFTEDEDICDRSFRFYLPLGIQGSEKITIQFMLLTTKAYKSTFDNVINGELGKAFDIYCDPEPGSSYSVNSSSYVYDGLAQYSNIPPDSTGGGTNDTYYAKVFDITINGEYFIDKLFIDFFPGQNLNNGQVTNLYFGVTKIFYEGANTQLTGIQDSINDMIGQIQQSGEAQQQINDFMMSVSPEGELLIEEINDKVIEVDDGLGEIIDVLEGIDKPPSEELLPDREVIYDNYMNSGGQDGVDAVFSPLFQEGSVVYIMLFSVLSIALISYVLYGKKAR